MAHSKAAAVADSDVVVASVKPAENAARTFLIAPAKINLALHVIGQRADGYHRIDSLAVFTRFGDRLSAVSSDTDEFSISGSFGGLPTDGSNLVIRARDALRKRVGIDHAPPVSILLEKNLPIASGVGGGSTDAACTLRLLSSLWSRALPEAELIQLAAELGADVPMCLAARPLIARGIGEELHPVPQFPPLAFVLVNPGTPVSTADVFGALASKENPPLPPLPRSIDFHSLRNWLDTTRNDLEPAATALQPAIGAALKALKHADAGFARMSGSGATCFGLFETGNVAKRAAIAIRARNPGWFVAATRLMETGA